MSEEELNKVCYLVRTGCQIIQLAGVGILVLHAFGVI